MSSEMYSGPPRALWELLQNADDCIYHKEPELLIEQTGENLWNLGLQELGVVGLRASQIKQVRVKMSTRSI